ncbi:MAG: HEAT repeat domain-containing protein [Chloroflexota bacterium]
MQLTDSQMQAYIVNGYVTVQTDFPPDFHAHIYQQAEEIIAVKNPWNDIYPMIPELAAVFAHPTVSGVLTSILGPNYIMHPHRHCHHNPPGSQAQSKHKDSYEEDENVHHHRTRWAMGFYYPQDVPLEMGPSAVQPTTQYYNTTQRANNCPELPLPGKAGTVTIIHYDLWHRGLANSTDTNRYMLKFLFCRTEEPQSPSWQSQSQAWASPSHLNPHLNPPHHHEQLWQSMWQWHMGQSMPPPTQSLNGQMNDYLSQLSNNSVDETQRVDAAYALGNMGEAVVPHLMDALYTEVKTTHAANLTKEHTNPSETYTGYALAAVGAPAVPALTSALSDDAWWMRACAADILGDIGLAAQSSVPALTVAMNDSSMWVRRNAAEALGIMGSGAASAVDVLADTMMHDDSDMVRHNAALALVRLGDNARPATSVLREAINDENLYVSGNSKIALERMER